MTIEGRFLIKRENFSLDVDFIIPGCGVTAIFGPSGCGKTSILRAIAGLDCHNDSFLKVDNHVWQDGKYFLPTHQRPLGYVFQEANLFQHLSVQGNLEYGIKRTPEVERRISLEKVIELLELEHLMTRHAHQLSGGERQRVAIARALSVSPRLLIMDEPLAALDMGHKKDILNYIESLQLELQIPVIYVSHSMSEVSHLADHLILLESGGIVAAGNIHKMLTRLDLPLAHDIKAEAIINATVAGYDEKYDLTYFDFAGGRIIVSRKVLSKGESVRLRIAARDVSLTLEHQKNTSILNIIPVTVDAISKEDSAQVTVRLLAGDVSLLSRITRKSAAELKLKPGNPVYAQVKSIALI